MGVLPEIIISGSKSLAEAMPKTTLPPVLRKPTQLDLQEQAEPPGSRLNPKLEDSSHGQHSL